MRKKTFASLFFILSCAIMFGLKMFAASYSIRLPLVGHISPLIAAVIILPIVLLSLGALNQRILRWRKARGRDIEEEEKHEFDDADIISLRPRQPHEHSSTYRRWDPDN